MHAIIETGGKQYKVTEGDTLFIEKLEAEAGQAIFKYNPKKGYRKRQGHRQPYTKVQIGAIQA